MTYFKRLYGFLYHSYKYDTKFSGKQYTSFERMERLVIKGLIIIVIALRVTTADLSQCVSNYQKLEKIFIKSEQNYGNLSEAFFITNRIDSQYVTINYRTIQCANQWQRNDNFTGCITTSIEKWIWSHSIIHILFHPYALNYLSLWYDETDERMADVTLTIPVLCEKQRDALLHRLTQLVSEKFPHYSIYNPPRSLMQL